MPTETNLPTKCLLYLELANRFMDLLTNLDSADDMSHSIRQRVDHLLNLATIEVDNWKEEE